MMIPTADASMKRMTYARGAGVALLCYFAAGIAILALPGQTQAINVLSLLTSFAALVLGAMLYAITREQEPALAMLALTCRVIEAVPGEGTIFFAVGNLLFSWLLLRGQMIPVALAWLGVLASVLMIVGLPLQLVGILPNSATWFMYIPMAAFEIPFALWLIVNGVAMPVARKVAV